MSALFGKLATHARRRSRKRNRAMAPIPRLKPYAGPALFSYGFRPFFLFGALYAGLAVLAWLPIFTGELALASAFVPRDWHVHEMLYGYVPAVVTGFLLTAIPNWTGRLPLQGTPLIGLLLVWIAGRVAVTLSGLIGWFPAALIDGAFLLLVAAAAAREIVAGGNWSNLKVVSLIALLALGNVCFHLEAHVAGSADISIRLGLAVVVMLITLIGGRIVPSFTRNWLARENPGRLPVPFGRFDMIVIVSKRGRARAVGRAAANSRGRRRAARRRRPAKRTVGALGRRPHDARAPGANPASWLRVYSDRISDGRIGGVRSRPRGCRHSCLGGRRGRHHDARGDDAREPRPYGPRVDRLDRHPGDLCCGGASSCDADRGGTRATVSNRVFGFVRDHMGGCISWFRRGLRANVSQGHPSNMTIGSLGNVPLSQRLSDRLVYCLGGLSILLGIE